MIRDLVEIAVANVKSEKTSEVRERAKRLAEERVLDELIPVKPAARCVAGKASRRSRKTAKRKWSGENRGKNCGRCFVTADSIRERWKFRLTLKPLP